MKTRKNLYLLLTLLSLVLSSCRSEVRAAPYFEKLNTRVAAGNPPDVGYVDNLRAGDLIARGVLQGIPNDLVDKDFYPQLLSYFQKDGVTYALPRDFQTIALLVNMDLFEKAGAPLPGDWSTFQTAAQKITELGGDIRGVGLTAGFFNFAPFLLQADKNPFSQDGTQINLQTDAARLALTFYAGLYAKQYVYDPQGQWPYLGIEDPGGMIDQFVDGKIGMFMVGPSMYNEVLIRANAKNPSLKMQLLELPAGPARKATIAYVVGFGVFSKPSDAAYRFLSYVTSQEGMRIWFDPQSLGLNPPTSAPPIYMPARQSLREEWAKAHPDAKAFIDGIDYAPAFTFLVGSYAAMTSFDQAADKIISQVVFQKIAVDAALEQLQATWARSAVVH